MRHVAGELRGFGFAFACGLRFAHGGEFCFAFAECGDFFLLT
jgi:hypothetical protein